jgi:catechol 2,3-dioxygenase-like lactoylglutathione lyase family enzyme
VEPTAFVGGSPADPLYGPATVTGLSHVEIYVSELSRSIEFWGWLLPQLGFVPYQEWESGKSWKSDSTYLVFVQAESPYREEPFHRKRPGINHLAFWAESTDEVEAITRELRSKGVRILYDDRSPEEIGAPSAYAVYFEDPDRIKVEIVVREEA